MPSARVRQRGWRTTSGAPPNAPPRRARAWPAALFATALLSAACGGTTEPPGGAGSPTVGSSAAAPATLAGAPYTVDFVTDGDQIQGWWWLRDRAGTDRARWVFRGVPTTGDLTLSLDLLATDGVNGGPGVDAQFWLSYGSATAETEDPAGGPTHVTAPNVSPRSDPVGYTTHQTFTVTRSSLPEGTNAIWVNITRNDGSGGGVVAEHLAVREQAVTIEGLGDGTTSSSSSTTSSASTTSSTDPPSGDGPGRGTPAVVSVGDSYIAGEGGRWAGNIDLVGTLSSDAIDALGPDAYFDNANATAESTYKCHRSESAEIHIDRNQYGPQVLSRNFACSGAQTTTFSTSEGFFKPGLDDYGDTDGNLSTYETPDPAMPVSQLVALREYARHHNVRLVVVSIGGNNFGFGGFVKTCVEKFLSYSYTDQVMHEDLVYCKDDAKAAEFQTPKSTAHQAEIKAALTNVHTTMAAAGYDDDQWTMLVQTYPSPLPRSGGLRYPELGWSRQVTGGCGFWDEDADWANDVALPAVNTAVKGAAESLGYANVRVLDIADAFVGRRLCEDTVHTLDGADLDSWENEGALDQTEWVVPIRTLSSSDMGSGSSPYQQQESFHPGYWGQLALRSCIRQAYNNGNSRGGRCVIAQNGENDRGEPVMELQLTN